MITHSKTIPTLLYIASICIMSGCGQKGTLYLPQTQTTTQTNSQSQAQNNHINHDEHKQKNNPSLTQAQ